MGSFCKGCLLGLVCGAAVAVLVARSGMERRIPGFGRLREAVESGRAASQAYDAELRLQLHQAIGAETEE
jgi:hypothetical protein